MVNVKVDCGWRDKKEIKDRRLEIGDLNDA
jgi:hypothetical protein